MATCQHCKTLTPGNPESHRCQACAALREMYSLSPQLMREFPTPGDYVSFRRAESRGAIHTLPALQGAGDEEGLIMGFDQVDEVSAKARFAGDKALQAEFYSSLPAFIAYLRGVSRGETKTVRTE